MNASSTGFKQTVLKVNRKGPSSMLEKENMAPNHKEFKPSGRPLALPDTPGKEVATLSAPALKASAVMKTNK